MGARVGAGSGIGAGVESGVNSATGADFGFAAAGAGRRRAMAFGATVFDLSALSYQH